MMNPAEVTDLKELKALAYDQVLLQRQVENNLQLLNQRIEELTQEAEGSADKPAKK